MPFPIFIVDAFSATPFHGNPAAVCILPTALLSNHMQQIALEMNQTETSFLYPLQDEANTYSLRWFTPTNEVPLCGHATMASAFALFTNGYADTSKSLCFKTLSGDLFVKCESREEGSPLLLQMDFPLGNPIAIQLSCDTINNILESLGIEEKPLAFHFCANTKKLLVDFATCEAITTICADTSSLMKILFSVEVRGIICTCGNTKDTSFEKYDFVSRYFAPWNGIPEDHVTGSAHTVLGAYWVMKKEGKQGKCEYRAYQASKRGGEMQLEVDKSSKRIFIKGTAVVVLKGHLE